MGQWDFNHTEAESRICTWVGKQRFANARRLDRDPGEGPPHDTDKHDIKGAHCEFAASVILNLFWRPSVGRIRDRDVGGLIEVRSTVLPNGRLIIKPKDVAESGNTPFVLVKCVPGEPYTLVGWQFASAAPRLAPLNTTHGDPAYFISQSDLLPMEELLTWIAGGDREHGLKLTKEDA